MCGLGRYDVMRVSTKVLHKIATDSINNQKLADLLFNKSWPRKHVIRSDAFVMSLSICKTPGKFQILVKHMQWYKFCSVIFADIDDCPSWDPCINGFCVDLVNDFECQCDVGYQDPTPSGCSGRYK